MKKVVLRELLEERAKENDKKVESEPVEPKRDNSKDKKKAKDGLDN